MVNTWMDHFSRFEVVVAATEKEDVMDSTVKCPHCFVELELWWMPVQLEMSSWKLGSIEELLLTNNHNQFVALICKINNVANKIIPTYEPENILSFIIKYNEGEPYSCFLFVSFLKQ